MIKNFLTSLGDLFYPRHCEGCEKALLQEEFLCHDCWEQLEPLSEPCCRVCSYPLFCVDSKTCSNCAERKLHFVAAVGAFHYRGLTKNLVSRYKYGRDQSLKALLQNLIMIALQDERLRGIDFVAVIPVPLYSLRERERGFNQVLPLAKAVARHQNLPLRSLLKRVAPTLFQAASDRQKRLKNLEGVFALSSPALLHGNYLLVDDVLTTGATLDECAKVLLEAGADQVLAVTLAR